MNRISKLSVSLMCADLVNLEEGYIAKKRRWVKIVTSPFNILCWNSYVIRLLAVNHLGIRVINPSSSRISLSPTRKIWISLRYIGSFYRPLPVTGNTQTLWSYTFFRSTDYFRYSFIFVTNCYSKLRITIKHSFEVILIKLLFFRQRDLRCTSCIYHR